MRDVAEWVRERPARKRVGAESLVHHGQSRHNSRVHEIRKEDLDLIRRKHPLVDQRARGETADVKLRRRFLDALPNQVKLSLEIIDGLEICVALDEYLLERRFDCFGGVTDRCIIREHVAPPEHFLSSTPDRCFHHFLAPSLRVRVAWQANHSDAIVTWRRKIET